MSDERNGIDRLRQAIDEVADGLPAREWPTPEVPRRKPKLGWAVAAACVLAAGAVAVYLRVGRPQTGPQHGTGATAVSLGIEVRLLRVNGRDVGARVFDAARAGTVVVAPEVERKVGARPVGAVALVEGGAR